MNTINRLKVRFWIWQTDRRIAKRRRDRQEMMNPGLRRERRERAEAIFWTICCVMAAALTVWLLTLPKYEF